MPSNTKKENQLGIQTLVKKLKSGNTTTYYSVRGQITFKSERLQVKPTPIGSNLSKAQIQKRLQEIEVEKLKELKDIYLEKNPKLYGFKEMTYLLLNDREAPNPGRVSTFKKNAEILGNRLITDIKQRDIDSIAYKRYPELIKYKTIKLSQIYNLKERQKVSSLHNTVNTMVMIPIGKVLHFAHYQGYCPYIKLKYFQTLNRKNMYRPKYSVLEIKKCIEYEHKDFQIVFLFVFLLFTGVRIAEALRIHWEDLDNEDNKVIDLDRKILRIIPNKDGTWTDKPMHPILYSWFQKVIDKSGYLFEWRSQSENKNKPNGLIPRWNSMQEFAGIDISNKRKKRHALRHTITSMLSDSGGSLQELMDFNGWVDERSALGYIETSNSRKKSLIDNIKIN